MAGPEAPLIWLRPLPSNEAAALLAGDGAPGLGVGWVEGYPMTETLTALAMLVEAHRFASAAGSAGSAGPAGSAVVDSGAEDPQPSWGLHQIVVGGQVVGDIGFHGPPHDVGAAEVEIGYAVVPGMRRRGIATRACRLLVDQAWRDGADVLRAEIDPDNTGAAGVASRRVLLRSGFRAAGADRYVIRRPAGFPLATR